MHVVLLARAENSETEGENNKFEVWQIEWLLQISKWLKENLTYQLFSKGEENVKLWSLYLGSFC